MAEKPIFFNDEMVRAILDGRKTQTRRPVKWPVMSRSDGSKQRIFTADNAAEMNQLLRERQRYPLMQIKSPYALGDLLYVRETWTQPENVIYYRADEAALLPPGAKWRPSIHMPKWAARIWLRVVAVRVERVRDISRDDVRAEGFPFEASLARGAYHFSDAWEAAYPGSWERNDWVWVYEFERAEAPRRGGWKMTDHYRQALEGLRERCAQEAERITARRRVIASMSNNEAMKPCKVASAIRKIDVQQYYECARAGLEMERAKNEEIAELQEQNKSLKAALWSAEHAMIDAVEHLDHGERDEARGILVDHPKKMVGQVRETAKVGR